MHKHIKITTKISNNDHSESSENELNGSLIALELKKPHPPRIVEGTQKQNGLVPDPRVVVKFGKDISGAGNPRPTPGPPAKGSSAKKISPHNFWLQEPMGIELVEEPSGASSSSS